VPTTPKATANPIVPPCDRPECEVGEEEEPIIADGDVTVDDPVVEGVLDDVVVVVGGTGRLDAGTDPVVIEVEGRLVIVLVIPELDLSRIPKRPLNVYVHPCWITRSQIARKKLSFPAKRPEGIHS